MRSSLCNSDHCPCDGHLRSSSGQLLKKSDDYRWRIPCCPYGDMEGRLYFFVTSPSPHCSLNVRRHVKRVSENVYAAVLALPLVRQDFAAASTALSSLSVSPAR